MLVVHLKLPRWKSSLRLNPEPSINQRTRSINVIFIFDSYPCNNTFCITLHEIFQPCTEITVLNVSVVISVIIPYISRRSSSVKYRSSFPRTCIICKRCKKIIFCQYLLSLLTDLNNAEAIRSREFFNRVSRWTECRLKSPEFSRWTKQLKSPLAGTKHTYVRLGTVIFTF